MAKAITVIVMVDEADFATSAEIQPITVEGKEPMTPRQIFDVLVQLSPEDLDDVFGLLQEHYDD